MHTRHIRHLTALIALALALSASHPVDAASLVKGNRQAGTVTVKTPDTPLKRGERHIVQLRKGDDAYSFPLSGRTTTVPNPLGNGVLQVAVVTGKTGAWRLTERATVTLHAKSATQALQQDVLTPGLAGNHVAYQRDHQFKGWQSWSHDRRVREVHRYVTRTFRYDHALRADTPDWYVPDYKRFMVTRKGICYDMASLTGSLLRSMGVPTRLVMGDVRGFGYHAWNEVYVGKRWRTVDTTADLGTTRGAYKSNTAYKQVRWRF